MFAGTARVGTRAFGKRGPRLDAKTGGRTVKRLFLGALLAVVGFVNLPVAALAEEKEQKLWLWGDFRARYEGVRFSQDETGSKKEQRSRIRYRFRLNAKAKLNDHAAFEARLGTGDLQQRTGNQTLGEPFDFAPNEIDIRRAYLIYYPWAGGKLPNREGSWAIMFGRVSNPFLWKNGQDKMLWDNDINPAGLSTTFTLGHPVTLLANAGYFVIQESSSGQDPWLGAGQVGVLGEFGQTSVGIRGSYYHFAELDSMFIRRGVDGSGSPTSSAGNIYDGLTGGGTELDVIEAQAFARVTGCPIVVAGGYSSNMSAEPSQLLSGVGKENVAYNFGGEIGRKDRILKVGGAWYHIEANAFPSQFVDSDILDGVTNRQGLLVYLQRQIVKSIDFAIHTFASDAINTDPNLSESVADSERFRTQVDVSYSF